MSRSREELGTSFNEKCLGMGESSHASDPQQCSGNTRGRYVLLETLLRSAEAAQTLRELTEEHSARLHGTLLPTSNRLTYSLSQH